MKLKYMIAGLTALLCLSSAGTAFCGDGWTMKLRARSLDAQNKLIIGQMPDATDGADGRYDVPAMAGGDLEAYSDIEGKRYWGDIRSTCESYCRNTWSIIVRSAAPGNVLKLTWDPDDVPDNIKITLTDEGTGEVADMLSGQNGYSCENHGINVFTVSAESQQAK